LTSGFRKRDYIQIADNHTEVVARRLEYNDVCSLVNSFHEVQAQVGDGRMGVAYRTRKTRVGRKVAIKVVTEMFTRLRVA
jgi:hypothetical protein